MLQLPERDLTAPLRAAMLARDPAALVATFAPDVVLRSPVTAHPFRGRDEVGELMTELLGALEDLEYTAVADGGDVQVLAFRMRLGGRDVELVDLVRHDELGAGVGDRRARAAAPGLRAVRRDRRPPPRPAALAVARRRGRAARPLPRLLAALDAAGARLVR